jgi:hypothetical protein
VMRRPGLQHTKDEKKLPNQNWNDVIEQKYH